MRISPAGTVGGLMLGGIVTLAPSRGFGVLFMAPTLAALRHYGFATCLARAHRRLSSRRRW